MRRGERPRPWDRWIVQKLPISLLRLCNTFLVLCLFSVDFLSLITLVAGGFSCTSGTGGGSGGVVRE